MTHMTVIHLEYYRAEDQQNTTRELLCHDGMKCNILARSEVIRNTTNTADDRGEMQTLQT